MTTWTAPDIASIRGDNSRPLQKIFGSLTEYLKDYQIGYTLNSLNDVTITTPVVGNVLSYDATNSLWINTTGSVITDLNASNLASGTVPTGRMSGSYVGITGVGTLGSLIVTGDLTVDTNTLRVDSTNNRVGINVTSPTSNLDVVGNQVIRAAATQDGIQLAGRAGGTTSLSSKFIPATLTANRTLTLPDVDGTLITTGDTGTVTNTMLAGSIATSKITGLATSATTDTTNAANISSGTLPSARISGSYTGITGVGTLAAGSIPASLLTGTVASARIAGAYSGFTSITVDGASSPAFTLGDWTPNGNYSGVVGNMGYLLVGNSSSDTAMYLRTSTAGTVNIGANGTDTLQVGNNDSKFLGTLNLSNVCNNTSDTKASNLWITSYLIANTGVTGSGQSAQWFTYLGLWYLCRNSSTRTEKENIQSLNGIVTPNMIDDIDVLLWSRKNAGGIPEIGPMAEDMDAISPFLSTRGIKDYDDEGNVIQTEPNGINTTSWMSLMTIAIQDIRKRLQQLETV